jgi:hypothetical protein
LKAFVFILILAAAAYWGYRHGYLKPERWLGGPAATSGGSSDESLQSVLNRGLPRMVTSEVSADRAVANNVTVAFDYRLVDLDQYAVSQRYGSAMPAEMQSALIRDLCANRDVREQVLARGREVLLQIHAQDGRTMFSAQLRPGGC